MPKDTSKNSKDREYLDNAFALANAWDSRRGRTPESEAREALKRDVPEVEPSEKKQKAKRPARRQSNENLSALIPEVAPPVFGSFDTDITRTLEIPVISASKAANAKSAQAEGAKTTASESQFESEKTAENAKATESPKSDERDAEDVGTAGAGATEAKATETGATETDATETTEDEDAQGKRKSIDPSKRAVANPEDIAKKAVALEKEKTKPERQSGSVIKVVGIAIAVVVLVAIGFSTYAALNRWVLTDDANDIRGTWRMDGATSSIVISDSTIDLAGQAKFDYVLDPGAKNIYEMFSNVSGEARYRFSDDRQSLALFDEGAVDWIDTAKRDFDWFMSCIAAKVSGKQEPDLLGGESGVILHRQTGTTASPPSTDAASSASE